MTSHVHTCPHCPGVRRCGDPCPVDPLAGAVSSESGPVEVALERRVCPTCEAIAEIDALPEPERRPLSYATVDRVVSRATRAAIQAAARDPEDGPRKFAEHVEPLYHLDPTNQTPDAWARRGAVLGACAGWSGETVFSMPPDCPMGPASRMYLGAWAYASGVVMSIRLEVGS
jgi:hypothetical protein